MKESCGGANEGVMKGRCKYLMAAALRKFEITSDPSHQHLATLIASDFREGGMTRWLTGWITAVALMATPSVGVGQEDLLLRVGAPVAVAAGDSGWTVVVINADATIDGRVHDALVVVNGMARIKGSVGGNVVVINGQAELGPDARIGGDLVLYRSTVAGATGTSVGGRTLVENGFSFGRRFLIFGWLACTVALTAAAAVFAGIGGGTLRGAMAVLRSRPAPVVASAAVTFVGLPLIAAMSFATVVGFLLGAGIWVVVMPALWGVGYLVSSTWFGTRLLRLFGAAEDPGRPYGAATLGVIGAQLVGLMPVLGGVVVIGAGALGAGALVLLGWERWRRSPSTATVAPPATMADA